ncbi:hypothetical protein SAMN04488540_101183 [Ferrimonas sediminum]|uniref:Secreted protein n=1 Tax=Ferrimonas sediminum TaxID=718193 RepID=A0A1G8JWW3_9GAMM|nr:hypothetical protein [Ferrimonas sediminum]SDI35658.1 hypothetical protein SAMN04488540_101183 [Ferrimonas sediminum]
MNSRLSAAAPPLLLTVSSVAAPCQQRLRPFPDASPDSLRSQVRPLNFRTNAIPVIVDHSSDPELVTGH